MKTLKYLLIFIIAVDSCILLKFQIDLKSIDKNGLDIVANDQIKYNGKGFTQQMQNILSQAIEDSAIFYKFNPYSQVHYISKMMLKIKSGNWNTFIIRNLEINRITDISTGFSFWSQNQIWALWYQATQFSKKTLHLVIYSGQNQKSYSNVTTQQNSVGSSISKQKADAISSVVHNLDTAQDISRYLQKLDNQKWSVISVPVILQGSYPQCYAKINANNQYVTYSRNVTLLSRKYSQIIYT